MMIYPTYTPILKTKRGEAKALANLAGQVKSKIIPFFDVLALKHDAENGNDVHEHMTKQALNIAAAWKQLGPCYVDFFDIVPSARGLNGTHPVNIVHNKIAAEQVQAIPVVGIERDMAYKLAIRSLVSAGVDAIAVRLGPEDLQLPSLLVARINKLVAEVGAANLPLHLFLDYRSIENVPVDVIQMQVAKSLIELRKLNPMRIVFAASAIVANMGNFKRNTVNRVKRMDFLAWGLIVKTNPDLDYGDYGVVHPDYFDFDPKVIRPAAKIRYTSDKEWIIVKGSCWRDNTSQHHELSQMLCSKPEFRGGDCWGSDYIAAAAIGKLKYGTLETWVTIDQNSHITHTVNQISNTVVLEKLLA